MIRVVTTQYLVLRILMGAVTPGDRGYLFAYTESRSLGLSRPSRLPRLDGRPPIDSYPADLYNALVLAVIKK